MRIFKDEQGNEVKLNELEKASVSVLNDKFNAIVTSTDANGLGVQMDLTTLTILLKTISSQKFYQIPLEKYLKQDIDGGWAAQLLQVREYLPTNPMSGFIDQSAHGAKMAVADAAVDGLYIPVITWAKQIELSIAEINQAALLGNYSLIEAKERSRKKSHDLDMQQLMFLGHKKVNGLLSFGSDVTIDTTTIGGSISDMSYTELNTFAKSMVEAFRQNCERTAYANKLVIPESDFNGLASQANPQFPLRTKLSMLKEAFDTISPRPVEILPCVYCDARYNTLGVNRYALYNDDIDTIRNLKAIDYTATMMNNIDGWNLVNTAFARVAGVVLNRPKEMMYFDVAAESSSSL